MHCVFISNCEHKALKKTRALLDRYAQRIGENAWASGMTEAGLAEIHKALRKQATRQSSIACYRNDAVVGLRLVWVVGNRGAYDKYGRFAVATRQKKANYPLIFRHAALVARLAGYAHDLGKASKHFQDKLYQSTMGTEIRIGDYIRHEWLSAWLLAFLTETGEDFSVSDLTKAWQEMKKSENSKDGPASMYHLSVGALTDGLSATLFGVATHHGAFGGSFGTLDGSLHIGNRGSDIQQVVNLLALAKDFPDAGEDGRRWQKVVGDMVKLRERIRNIGRPPKYWEGVMLVARAALILADHKISSQKFPGLREEGILFANTKKLPDTDQPKFKKTRTRQKVRSVQNLRYLDQPLSWHLLQVGDLASQNVRMFTGRDMPTLDSGICDELMRPCSDPNSRFIWQDKAVDAVKIEGGKLIFNVASTGAGKTLANLKMAVSARNSEDVRVAVAFNLRSLTTQTFTAFKDHLGSLNEKLFKRDFACLIGDHGAIEVDFSKEDEDDVDDIIPVDVAGAESLLLPKWLNNLADETDSKRIKLLATPILVSTMDWIVASGEPGQQARHAQAMIRVATSDLILDEVDSYDVAAAVAVMRVVKTAAMFGQNVVVSSATLNPALAEGIIEAFAAGRKIYEALFGTEMWTMFVISDSADPSSLSNPLESQAVQFYNDSLNKISNLLQNKPITKRFKIAEINGNSVKDFNDAVVDSALFLHKQQAQHYPGLKKDCLLSLGLVRVANIKPCMELSDYLLKDGRFIVSAYHARDIFEKRAAKEAYLDEVLSRKPGDDNWLNSLLKREPWLKEATGDVCLVIVATPVEEVGRDHDFDWAIIEPSSMHSLVQTAGRVNRHRQKELKVDEINVVILDKNVKAVTNQKKVFTQPGLEIVDLAGNVSTHPEHRMSELLKDKDGNISYILDSRLVFDKVVKTNFASYDEHAIKTMTNAIIDSISEKPKHELDFMLKKYALDYRLRSGLKDDNLLLDIDKKEFRFEFQSQPAGTLDLKDFPANTWAVCGLNQLEMSLKAPLKIYKDKDGNIKKPIKIDVCWNGLNLCL